MSVPIIILLFFIFLALAVPISSSLALVSAIPGAFDDSFTASGGYIVRSMISGIDSFPLLAIPMFVLSGVIMARGGISKKLFEVCLYFIGKCTAGMPCAVVITCLFYGAISGSAPATVAAVGSMTIPILVNMKYDKVFAVSLVAIAGGLGVIIPPSIPFILYGTASGASVGKLFMAGILPGILIALLLMGYAVVYCRKHGEDRATIDDAVDALRSGGFAKLLFGSVWALLTPVIILGCIYSGIASPTEAAVISVFYSLVVAICFYKTLKLTDLFSIFREAARTYAPILFILAASVAFSRVLTIMQVPTLIRDVIFDNFTSGVAILIVINIALLFVGMIMDVGPAIMILTPILLPIVTEIGVDPVHFGVIMVVNLCIGFVTPPIGINLFVASSMSNVPVMSIAKKAVPMIVAFLVALTLITFIPWISMALVR
ncbi:MAG: TRAP transporter large permease [Planctomycetes bacterium]|nr:TRAP transporter large permease [Planctomycetota bacterium]